MGALSKVAAFLAALRRAAAFYRVPYPTALLRSAYLYFAGQFSRKEIVGYGLFVPSITTRIPVLISKERSLAKLARFNPPARQHLTESKDEFYAICRRKGLPIPDTYAWTRDGRRYDADGDLIEGDRAWRDYLTSRLPHDFIVKDKDGAYGSGFVAFDRRGNSFHRTDRAVAYDIGGLALVLSPAAGDADIVIQRRVFDDARLAALSGRRGLQTLRVNTLLEADGRVSILFYMIKILAGATISDNFSMGTTGNLIAYGDRDDGVLRGAVNIHECGSGMRRVATHPDAGIAFDGFRLPHWAEAIELAKTGQRCFAELPTLGWDIALTADGPLLIEANARWDPPLYAPFLMTEEYWRRIFGT
ncbi:MAG: sugar-transfer associated ATP-grasp domain-containing protein [Casimicrobiaceae bacterium]